MLSITVYRTLYEQIQTIINVILALSYVLIDIQKYCKSFNMLLTGSVAKWLEGHAGKRGVAGSITGGGIYFHFEFFAWFPLLTARRSPYLWNKAWHSSRVMGAKRDLIFTNMAAVYMTTCQLKTWNGDNSRRPLLHHLLHTPFHYSVSLLVNHCHT